MCSALFLTLFLFIHTHTHAKTIFKLIQMHHITSVETSMMAYCCVKAKIKKGVVEISLTLVITRADINAAFFFSHERIHFNVF